MDVEIKEEITSFKLEDKTSCQINLETFLLENNLLQPTPMNSHNNMAFPSNFHSVENMILPGTINQNPLMYSGQQAMMAMESSIPANLIEKKHGRTVSFEPEYIGNRFYVVPLQPGPKQLGTQAMPPPTNPSLIWNNHAVPAQQFGTQAMPPTNPSPICDNCPALIHLMFNYLVSIL